MIQETSQLAFNEIIPELGDRQMSVYKTIKKLGYCSNSMVSKYLNLPINCVTPRCQELRLKGLIEFSHITNCPVTRRKVNFWTLTK